MKKPLLFLHIVLLISIHTFSQVDAGRMNEVFVKTDLQTGLSDPWEITYGPDDSLWVTEAKGYRVRKINPVTGGMRTVLDLTTFLDPASTPTNKWQKAYTGNSPQGGLMGLAIHPDFMTAAPANKYVYLAYIKNFVGNNQTYNGEMVTGDLYITWLVRFSYIAGMLRNPVAICDTIRGSDDHNSGRMIIAREDGLSTSYLYYAVGDMGAGQYDNVGRVIKAQWNNSYEGKILRFNLDGTIPASNPFGTASAVWAKGIRNNQGFAYARINGVDRLYGASHGPFSDDELNILEKGMNYGHPLVIGKKADDNYNNSKAATPASILPLINDESYNADTMVNYKDALFTAYAVPAGNSTTPGTINYIYNNNPTNANWPSEGWSGLGIYTDSKIPGWKNALVVAGLKWGRLIKIKLNPDGDAVIPTGAQDTVSYFGSQNRFRDMAFDPNGKIMYVAMDASTTSSGPSSGNPIVPNCLGCIHRYTFVGYNNNAGASTIPTTIPVARGVVNTCTNANSVTINAANNNNNIWVPITDDSSNVIAEIKANGNNIGLVTTSFFYKNSGSIREESSPQRKLYMDRNISISVQTQPTTAVNIRLYITGRELTRMIGATNSLSQPSGIATINDVSIFKNNNSCNSTITSGATKFTTTRAAFGTNYVLTATIPSFSSFFFASNALTTLPVNLISFTGELKPNKTVELNWKTSTELNMSKYEVERSIDGQNYVTIGTTAALGGAASNNYSYVDNDAAGQPAVLLYYRLKMIDIDESYKHSNIATISLSNIAGKVIVTPNPTADFTKLTITAAGNGNANWQVVDNSGRIVLQSNMQLKAGNNTTTINVSKLAAGMYYIKVKGTGVDANIKLQKL